MVRKKKCTSKFLIKDVRFKNNAKDENPLNLSRLKIDTYGNNAKDVSFQSTSYLHENKHFDALQMHFKVILFF